MPHLLHLDASARSRSLSRALTARFAHAWRAADQDGRYTYRDLATDPPPPIGQAWTEICDDLLRQGITDPARYPEVVTTPERAAAWAIVEPLLDEVLAADIVLIGSPMYNYSVPGVLKTWIDQITFPRMSFKGKGFVVISARGGAYGPGAPKAPFDHQERYLRDFFAGHFAVEDARFLSVELSNTRVDPVLGHLTADHRDSAARAETAVDELVATLWAG
ncbi:FMN-dependent NADH-azoreductase [Actinokineospora terrae]|uniref:FMN dependent NADH:quinone oxidoreductase n=1 Tax=Actinokineospora terrae TaxID=155974 RepID=A0A1H9X228_9PSEU|nr:NAD(P)H-dependent oxidoreductase [Actinokineospora terrae]SES39937.1 FMN-dependent NADH-azoreductase [Actinokineospora terrae]